MPNASIWEKRDSSHQKPESLQENIEVDVAIIGAGITGITTAINLIGHKKSIAILEAGRIGSGTTGNSTGNLYVLVQPYYKNIARKFNEKIANAVLESRKFAIDYIESLVNTYNLDCHFSRRPTYFFTTQENHVNFIKKEVNILQNAGIEINCAQDVPFSIRTKFVAELENQARMNPLLYVQELAEILHKKGVKIYEDTQVLEVDEGETCVLKTESGKTVHAKCVVVATHTPKGINRFSFLVAPYRSYALAVKLNSDYPNGHFWDYEHFISSTHAVAKPDKLDYLIIAGSHHKTGQDHEAKHNFSLLSKYLQQHFDVKDVHYQWSAQHYQAADDIPYIGESGSKNKNVYVATGFFADGLVYGSLAGKIIADTILGEVNPWADLYDARRMDFLKAAPKTIKEGVNVMAQYAKDLPMNVDAKHFEDIKKGQGKTIEIGGEKYAAYRDENNQLHVVSAVCTHMKCVVEWNNAEITWDCPCHGSRFTVGGEVIEGPAYANLKKANVGK